MQNRRNIDKNLVKPVGGLYVQRQRCIDMPFRPQRANLRNQRVIARQRRLRGRAAVGRAVGEVKIGVLAAVDETLGGNFDA